MTEVNKYVGSYGNVEGIRAREWSTQEERFDNLADTFVNKMRPGDHVVLEGYAMGAKGLVFHIGENTGVLKNRLWRAGVMYDAVSPSVIKKHATGKGNADKAAMNEAFVKLTGIDLKKKMEISEKNWSPSGDVIDAFFACSLAVSTVLTPK